MDDDLRMKLADLGSPEALADCIIDHFADIDFPVRLDRIAEAVGIVEVIGQRTDGFEGVLITDAGKSKGSIAYNDSSPLERRRFTIAHELGHFLLPLHGANAQCAKADLGVLQTKDPNRAREAEANRFAASLVMPKKLFLRDIRRLGAPETGHIAKLAADYQVSKEAAARRYTDLCDHTCAVIFSHRGKLRYSCRTVLKPLGVAVVIEAVHECMTTRGVHKTDVTMVTSQMLGVLRSNAVTRQEFLSAIGRPRLGTEI